MSDIVQKLWGFCHVLRHDGIDYGDYIEQLTYLLFLKMADERGIDLSAVPITNQKGKTSEVDCSWPTLYKQTGTGLIEYYIDVLRTLGKQTGLLGDIFAGAQSRFNNPVNLKRMLTLINETEWTALDVDVKAQAFEGLLEKAASEGKKGAGQYFTPRVLIKSIVRCMKPDPRVHKEFTIGDPACGTGGFLVAAYEWLIEETKGALERDVAKRVKKSTYFGQDLVERPRRLALMNLYLHGLEPEIALGDAIYEVPSSQRFDVVLTNPPFGTKGANQAPEREDFTIETSNKQLNFLQHVLTTLKPGGRAAIVLPDNCLFEGKAGEVFEIVMQDCNVHTILRLPRGTFSPYSQGVKANVVFFQKGFPTESVWIFDARSNVPGITKKERPLTSEHFAEFEKCYGTDPNGRSKRKDLGETGRSRKFHLSDIKERDYKLDITWLKDESLEDAEDLPEPQDLAAEAITELEAVVDDLREVVNLIDNDEFWQNNLGETWRQVALGEITSELITGPFGSSLHKADYVSKGIPVVNPMNMVNGRIVPSPEMTISQSTRERLRRYILKEGDIILARRGEMGRCAIVTEKEKGWLCGTGSAILRLKKTAIPEFIQLAITLPSSRAYLNEGAVGSTMANLNQRLFRAMPIELPPVAQQHEIIRRIRVLSMTADAIEARQRKAKGHVDKLTLAIIAKAFRGDLVPASVLLERIRQERNGAPIKKAKIRRKKPRR